LLGEQVDLLLAQAADGELGGERARLAALHLGHHDADVDAVVDDIARAGTGTAAGQPARLRHGLDRVDERLAPPGAAESAAPGAGRHAAGRSPARPPAHSPTASAPRVNSSRSSSAPSSVIHCSPAPTARSASLLLPVIISSMRSSMVSTHTSLRTCTSRRWPMRKTRSVAWFSTAGFHQRSRCTT